MELVMDWIMRQQTAKQIIGDSQKMDLVSAVVGGGDGLPIPNFWISPNASGIKYQNAAGLLELDLEVESISGDGLKSWRRA